MAFTITKINDNSVFVTVDAIAANGGAPQTTAIPSYLLERLTAGAIPGYAFMVDMRSVNGGGAAVFQWNVDINAAGTITCNMTKNGGGDNGALGFYLRRKHSIQG